MNLGLRPCRHWLMALCLLTGLAPAFHAVAAKKVPPTITTQPQDLVVITGGAASFSVTATGTTPLYYQWRKNGVPIPGATASSYSLATTTTNDAAGYDVVVNNAVGTATSATATLTVYVPPWFTLQPTSLVVTRGNNATFTVGALGIPTPALQWSFGSNPLLGEVSSTLSLINVQASQAGRYYCVATNVAGSVTSAVAVLTVLGPPVITEQPASLSAIAGTNVSFTVTASGTEPLSYQWQFNGTKLSDGGQFSGATGATLSISNVQPASAGNYTVVITNVAGSTVSAVATLTVNLPGTCLSSAAGLVGWWPGDGNANDIAGTNNGTLQVGATAGGAGLVGSAFTFDGTNGYVQIPDSPILRPTNLTIEAWVTFSGLDSALSGNAPAGDQYIVFKQNSQTYNFEGYSLEKYRIANGDVFMFTVGSASGQEVFLLSATLVRTSVWYHVAAVRGSNFMQLYINGQLESQTNVSFAQDYGTLPLYFGTSHETYWDGKLKGSLDEVSLYNRALASNEVAAIYAAGAAGKCKAVIGASITTPPQSQSVVAGNSATFTVAAAGTPPLSYQWRFNGANLSGATTTSLTLAGVQPANAGSYTVVVTNSAASATSAAAVLTVLPGAETLTVNGAQTYQIIDGFGVNANHRAWTNRELQPVLDALIDQAGMTQFRVVYDNCDWETKNDNRNPNVMNWTYYSKVYSTPEFQALWGIMAYLNQKGITNGVMPNFQGFGPSWMGGLSLTPGYENEWAEMIASALVYARYTNHLQFTVVGPNNEPDIPGNGIGTTAAQYVVALHDLSQQLDANGMGDVRFVGPDLAYTSTAWLSAMMNDSTVMAKLAAVGVHGYQGVSAGSAGVYTFLQQSAYPNLHFWMTEFNVWCDVCQSGGQGASTWAFFRGTAEYLLEQLANNASGGMVWDGYDGIYLNTTDDGKRWSFWGLFAVNDTNAVPKTYTARKNFYTLAQITKFVRPGAARIDVSGSVSLEYLLAFYNTNNGQFTLTGVNTNSSASSLSCALTSLPAIPSLDLYYTSSSTNLCYGAHVAVNNGVFSVVVPADCVFTLTYTNTVATPAARSVSLVAAGPPTLAYRLSGQGEFQLAVAGQPLQRCTIEVSDDLVHWSELTNVTLQDGTARISAPMTASRQFYRARLLP